MGKKCDTSEYIKEWYKGSVSLRYLIVSQVKMRKSWTFLQGSTRKRVKFISGNAKCLQWQANFVENVNRKWRHTIVSKEQIFQLLQIAERGWHRCQTVALKINLKKLIELFKKNCFHLESIISVHISHYCN